MTIGQGQQGLKAMAQPLTPEAFKKSDDNSLLKLGPKSHTSHFHWLSLKETKENLPESMVFFP